VEELARHSSSVAMAFGMDVCFGAVTIDHQGTRAQKEHYLPKIVKGEMHFALSLTEPGGGTDILGATKTKAVEDGDCYIINGTKMFTTGANIATHLFVVARTDSVPDKPSFGLTIFLIPKDTPGVTLNKIEKLGSKFLHSYEVVYEDVRVPGDSMIGERGRGWHGFLATLNNERIFIGAVCLGLAQGAFEAANQYAKERIAFGRPIGQFQAVQHQLADTLMEIELARLITYKAAWKASRGLECSLEAAMSKYYASETAFRATDRGMRVMAGYGFTMEYHMQRYYRDVRQFIFAPITNEMNRNFIGQVGCGLPKSY
jgi:acyl-CoA dehydrogenase